MLPHSGQPHGSSSVIAPEEPTAFPCLTDDALHFNTLGAELGAAVSAAVQHVSNVHSVHAVVLQASGPHFCVGGNPYYLQQVVRLPTLAQAALACDAMLAGFVQLRSLPTFISCAVHGSLIGGGIAGAPSPSPISDPMPLSATPE